MKQIILRLFFCLISAVVLTSPPIQAQTNTSSKPASPGQDQTMKDLLTEVRQLRLEVRQMATSVYRAQTMLERVRVQQEQVSRLALELSKVQMQISELRSRRMELQGRVPDMEKKFDVGLLPETEVTAIKSAIESLNQRESELTDRESKLTTELNTERGQLALLNRRLDEIEQELQSISKGDGEKPVKKE